MREGVISEVLESNFFYSNVGTLGPHKYFKGAFYLERFCAQLVNFKTTSSLGCH